MKTDRIAEARAGRAPVPRRPSPPEQRVGLWFGARTHRRRRASLQPAASSPRPTARRIVTPRSTRSATDASTSTTRPATSSSPSTSKARAARSSCATTCGSPTSSGRLRRAPTATSSPRTGRRRGASTGWPCCERGDPEPGLRRRGQSRRRRWSLALLRRFDDRRSVRRSASRSRATPRPRSPPTSIPRRVQHGARRVSVLAGSALSDGRAVTLSPCVAA